MTTISNTVGSVAKLSNYIDLDAVMRWLDVTNIDFPGSSYISNLNKRTPHHTPLRLPHFTKWEVYQSITLSNATDQFVIQK